MIGDFKALKIAIGYGDCQLVEYLLAKGAATNESILECAASHPFRACELSRMLLRAYCPVSYRALRYLITNTDAGTLRLALHLNLDVDSALIKLAILAGYDMLSAILSCDPHIDSSTLRLAIRVGDINMVELLMAHNPMLDASLINAALISGHFKLARMLASRNVPATTDTLRLATRYNQVDIINNLTARGIPE